MVDHSTENGSSAEDPSSSTLVDPLLLPKTVYVGLGRLKHGFFHEIYEKFESSWFLEKVKIKNLDENEEQIFLIRQWLDKNSEKGIYY